jgi:predicted AAA+ superfamily ATPase
MDKIPRKEQISRVLSSFEVTPIVTLLGPRQSGKTTLARDIFQQRVSTGSSRTNYFDLEDPESLARLDNPKLALSPLRGLIVIDEIQRRPELFPLLRVLVDEPDSQRQFLILGSASTELIKQSSETLAGRVSNIELTPLGLGEVGVAEIDRLWLRGGFPRSFTADSDQHSFRWRQTYINTYLERDIPALGFDIPAESVRRFWMMLAHYHGQKLNSSAIATSLGISDHTVRRYLEILSGTFMMRILQPWSENIGKRQVKAPKLYFRDSGIFHALLQLSSTADLLVHPLLGASWEGLAMEAVAQHFKLLPNEMFFWGIHGQAELDTFVVINSKRVGFEIKYTDQPKITSSMKNALKYLDLDQLYIVYPGEMTFQLSDRVTVVGLSVLTSLVV